MTLTRLLFEPALVRSPLRIVQWWESRRPLYNGIVGAAGILALGYAQALELVLGHGWLPVPWYAVAAYGVAANVCFTFGWIVENVVERFLGRPVYGLGPALFRHGLVFSIGLTLLPAGLITVANIAGWLFG